MASQEKILIRSFLETRSNFDKFGPYILAVKNLDRNMAIMLGYIKDFYERYQSATSIPEPDLRVFIKTNDPLNFEANNSTYIQDIYKFDVSNNDLTMDVIEQSLEKHFMAQIIDKAGLVLDNNRTGILSEVQTIIEEYNSLLRCPPDDTCEYILDLDELLDEEVVKNGAPFVNKSPNDVIRGMRVGQLGLIYAYVDTGKTSYGVANACSVARYLHANNINRPVIYGCNEEAVTRITLRSIQCLTGWSDEELNKNRKAVPAILKHNGFDKMKFVDRVNDMRKVEKILMAYNPRALFIDLGTKVNLTRSKLEGVDALERKFNIYRDLAKKYQTTIIAMAQGGDECFNKQYPSLRDIYGSKSAVQGELDWAISIGVDNSDTKYIGWRYFAITKNKGDKATFACRFDSKRCNFKEDSP